MRSNFISRHLSVREQRKERVDDIVGESPPVVWKARRVARVIVKDVRQQRSGDTHGVLVRIAACMFQFMREDPHKTIIVR